MVSRIPPATSFMRCDPRLSARAISTFRECSANSDPSMGFVQSARSLAEEGFRAAKVARACVRAAIRACFCPRVFSRFACFLQVRHTGPLGTPRTEYHKSVVYAFSSPQFRQVFTGVADASLFSTDQQRRGRSRRPTGDDYGFCLVLEICFVWSGAIAKPHHQPRLRARHPRV